MEAFRFNTGVAELMTLQNAISKAKTAGAARDAAAWDEARRAFALLSPRSRRTWPRSCGRGWAAPARSTGALAGGRPRGARRRRTGHRGAGLGKLRGEVTVPADADAAAIVAAAKAAGNVARHLIGMQIVREIVVPGKLVNLVVKPA